MRRDVLLSTLCIAGIAATAPLGAQTAQTFSVQGSLLGAAFSGGDQFRNAGITFDPGGGMELQFRYNPSALSIGAGFQYTSHGVTVEGASGVDVTMDFTGVFLEPRYVIFVGSERAAPYIAGRLMALVSTVSIPSIPYEEDFDAWGYNVGGGFLFRAGNRLNIDLGLTAGGVTFIYEDPSVDAESGTSVVMRIGLAYGI